MERLLLLATLIILANRVEGGLVRSLSGTSSVGCAPSDGVVLDLIELLQLLVNLLRVLLLRHREHVRLILLVQRLHVSREVLQIYFIFVLLVTESRSLLATLRGELLGVHLVQEVAKLGLHAICRTLSVDTN